MLFKHMMLQLTYKYVLILLGILLFSLFFWNRYVRERLPKGPTYLLSCDSVYNLIKNDY